MTREELLKIAKPVLFNTVMVIAILEDRKTATRRVVKPQPDEKHNFPLGFVSDSTDKKDIGKFGFGIDEYGGSVQYAKPPCKKGDYLYVRETWSDHYVPDEDGKPELQYCYKADGIDLKAECLPGETNRWYPSIHMPKEAARIFLKVTDVRVERLQDIDDKGAYMEGAGEPNTIYYLGARVCEFAKIWNSTIKKQDLDKYGWDANPWVWVIEFERVGV